ncbi:glycoside hydrolase family 19 protein, partial [Shinella zoogloeoides]
MHDDLAAAFNKYAAAYGVNNQKRISEFLANVCHETGGFNRLSENLNYSVEGLMKTFGRHRISAADVNKLGRSGKRAADQKAIANKIYGGDWGRTNLGNTQPNDGWDYRGSGPGQVTGRANFAKVEKESGIPVVANPDLLRQADAGMKAALILWRKWGLNEMADNGQTTAIRKRWNGGSLGLTEVTEARGRAMKLKLTVPASTAVTTSTPTPAPPSATPTKKAGWLEVFAAFIIAL